jgi:DNA polymerase-3 subunit gamma/tau
MDKFIVSARKYRPQTFETVVGQSHITTTLKNAIKNEQLAHAFLFCGPRGVGKTTCARILAKTINCEKLGKNGEACDKCQSCTSFNDGASLNYFELDAASNNSVDDIRQLTEQVRFAPQAGKYKVYVIDEVHMLSSAAFNAFLKTLEEPPSYAIFILATTEKHKILPTILSRCQIFDFKRITNNDTVEHLEEICKKENISAEKAALQIIAQKSEGCMRDSLSILDKIVSFSNGKLTYNNTLEHLNILDADYYFQLLDLMLAQDLAQAMLLFDEINQKGFEGDLVLNGLAEFFRNLLVCKDQKAASLLEAVENFRTKYLDYAGKIDASFIIGALNIINEAELNYKAARNKRLHVELALIKLCFLQQAISLTAGQDGSISKKKLIDGPLGFKTAAIRPFYPSTTGSSSESGAKLIIETSPATKKKAETDSIALQSEKPPIKTAAEPAKTELKTTGTKLSALSKIREQYQQADNRGNLSQAQPLELSILQESWKAYISNLKEAKNPASQAMEFAELRIKDESSFEVVTSNNIEQKFIEQERNHLFKFLQEKLKNKSLQFNVIIEEKPMDKPLQEDLLSAKDQYLKMIEQYPQIKDLKDKLRLELDY